MTLHQYTTNSAQNRPYFFTAIVPFVWYLKQFVSFTLPFICPLVGSKLPFIYHSRPGFNSRHQREVPVNMGSKAPIEAHFILSKARGFTLTELAITLAIGGILTALALPNFRDYIQNTRLVTSTNEFLTASNLARTEAITRNTRVRVCASSNATTAIPPSCAGNWQQGWIMFEDCDDDGVYDNTAAATDCLGGTVAETLIRVGVGLTVAGTVTDGDGVSFIEFLSTGLYNGDGNSFDICIDGMSTGRQITISALGQATISNLGC